MRSTTGTGAVLLALALAALAGGCGGRASQYARSAGGVAYETTASYGGGSSADVAERDEGGEVYFQESVTTASTGSADAEVASTPPAAQRPMLAQAREPRRRVEAPLVPPEPQEQASGAEVATDAVDTSGPLLVYTALFHLAVYEVRESQARIVAAARELGGFVSTQADDRLIVRVPAPRFHAMVVQVERAGDVEHREVQAQDVGEEFHDLEIRIRNLEAMRQRVEALLAQARTVEDALRVEQELQRLTAELERMRGRQRFLADRISFSTLTVVFRPRPREQIGQPEIFQLPFAWLEQLGLSSLLELR